MADIPGFKNIRLMAQKPIAIGHWDKPGMTVYTMEVTFEDDSIVNVPLTKSLHDTMRARMATQAGVGLEERMAARGAVVLEGEQKTEMREQVLPLDASGQQVVEALQSVAGQNAVRCKHDRWPWEGCTECLADTTKAPKLPRLLRLDRELEELERTDPAVGEAARRLNKVKEDVVKKGRKT